MKSLVVFVLLQLAMNSNCQDTANHTDLMHSHQEHTQNQNNFNQENRLMQGEVPVDIDQDSSIELQAKGMMFMQMYFYMGVHVVYLFQDLRTENTGTYILCLVITFILAIGIEGLNFLRYHLQAGAYSKLNVLIDKRDNSVYKLSCQIRFIISLVYLLSIFLSYMLMLIVMTFNGGVFIVTVLGLTTGYFIFGFIRKTKYTRIYNPEGDKCCAEVDG